MKKLLVLALLCLSAQSFAQICEVDMVDQYNRVVRTFRAYGNPDSCIEGMKECRKSIRLDYSRNPQYPNGTLDCVRVAGNTYPTPTQPTPTPSNPMTRYLSMSDAQVGQEAMYGIGRCSVTQGSYYTSCGYYVKVNGYGYPSGSGCASPTYAAQLNCNRYTELESAGCMVKVAIQNRQCL